MPSAFGGVGGKNTGQQSREQPANKGGSHPGGRHTAHLDPVQTPANHQGTAKDSPHKGVRNGGPAVQHGSHGNRHSRTEGDGQQALQILRREGFLQDFRVSARVKERKKRGPQKKERYQQFHRDAFVGTGGVHYAQNGRKFQPNERKSYQQQRQDDSKKGKDHFTGFV